jgi:carbonic anhydrase
MHSLFPRSRLTVAVMVVVGLASAAIATSFLSPETPSTSSPNDPEMVLAALKAGNARFVSSRRTLSTDTAHDADMRRRLAAGQHPFACILCCSDSRVCPEFIFDSPPGSFFEIRNAGNVVEDDALASMEYAVEHLGVRFVLVLAHTGCGAIEAVVDADGHPLHDHLRDLQERITCLRSHSSPTNGEPRSLWLNQLSYDNAREQAQAVVKQSAPIRSALEKKQVRLIFGIYDIESGAVEYRDLP